MRNAPAAAAFVVVACTTAWCLDGMVLQTTRAMFNGGMLTIHYLSTGTTDTIVNNFVYGPSFSPDGLRIAYGDETLRKICTVDIDGTDREEIAFGNWTEPTVTWASDGYIYFTYKDPNIYRVKPDGTGRKVVFTSDANIHAGSVSQNGLRAAWTRPMWSVSVGDLATGEERSFGGGCQGTVSPDGELVTRNSNTHTEAAIMAWDGSEVRTIYSPTGHFNLHRWAHHAQDYVCYTLQESNTGCVFDLVTDSVHEIGWGLCWDYYPAELQAPPPVAKLRLSTDEVDFAAPPGGAATPPFAIVEALNRADSVELPPLSVSGVPPWLQVTVEGSGNRQTLTNAVDMSLVSGEQILLATVTVHAAGAVPDEAQYTVRLIVSGYPVQASVMVTPPAASLAPGEALQLVGLALDQYGKPMAPVPVLSWECDGGGTVNDYGLFTAGNYHGGPYEVRAIVRGDTGRALITVITIVRDEAVVVVQPDTGVSVAQGDTLVVVWDVDCPQVAGVRAELSLDKGENWTGIENSGTLPCGVYTWRWPVPYTIEAAGTQRPTVSDSCIIRIANYLGQGEGLSGVFAITPGDMRVEPGACTAHGAPAFAVRVHADGAMDLSVNLAGAHRLTVMSLDGRTVRSFEGCGVSRYSTTAQSMSAGTYVAGLHDAAGRCVVRRRIATR